MKLKFKCFVIFLILFSLSAVVCVSASDIENNILESDENIDINDSISVLEDDNDFNTELSDETDVSENNYDSPDETYLDNEVIASPAEDTNQSQQDKLLMCNDEDSLSRIENSTEKVISKSVSGEDSKLGSYNVYIKSTKVRYNSGKYLYLGWSGYFSGYFLVYKGASLKYSEYISGYNQNLKWSLDDMSPGKYKAKLVSDYSGTVKTGKIIIIKSKSKISVKSFTATAGNTFYCYAYVKDRYTGNNYNGGIVKFKINGKTYRAGLKNGVAVAKIKIPSKVKKYICKATFTGGKNVYGKSTKFRMTVKPGPVYKTVRIPTKMSQSRYITKYVGNYKVQTFKFKHSFTTLCVFLYKYGKMLGRYKFLSSVSYKYNGKWHWTNWKYGTDAAFAYHKYSGISNNLLIGDVKVKFRIR